MNLKLQARANQRNSVDGTYPLGVGRNRRPVQSQTHQEPARVPNTTVLNAASGFLSTSNKEREPLLTQTPSADVSSALVNPSIGLHSALDFPARVGRGNLPVQSDKSVINVHQHFNQPNIMNFNHNDYFDKVKNMNNSLRDAFYPSNQNGNEHADSDSSTIRRGTTAII